MTPIALSTDTSFTRTRLTWLGYAVTACFGFALSLLGPMMPFLAAKLDLTFTQIGYHFTLMAGGVIVISLIGDKLAKWLGSNQLLWGGALLMAVALAGVVMGSSLPITLTAMFLHGCGIGVLATISNAVIAISARQYAAKAFTEANIAAGIAMIIGPILVGLIAKSTLGWQAAACLPLIFVVSLKISFWGVLLPKQEKASESVKDSDNRPLPLLFWVFGLMMFLSVAIEWMISSLGASFLTSAVGFEVSTAASLVSVFAVAMVLGRLGGRRLLDYVSESRLLILSLVWVLLAFPIYWLGTLPLVNVVGMFLIGLGVGNLAPLSTSGAMTAAGEATNRAGARFSMFPSLSTIIMVQLLSILADQFGIQRAYALMIFVVIMAFVVALSTNRLRKATA